MYILISKVILEAEWRNTGSKQSWDPKKITPNLLDPRPVPKGLLLWLCLKLYYLQHTFTVSRLCNVKTQITSTNTHLSIVLNSFPVCIFHWLIPYSFGISNISGSLSKSMFHFQEVSSYSSSGNLWPRLANLNSSLKWRIHVSFILVSFVLLKPVPLEQYVLVWLLTKDVPQSPLIILALIFLFWNILGVGISLGFLISWKFSWLESSLYGNSYRSCVEQEASFNRTTLINSCSLF